MTEEVMNKLDDRLKKYICTLRKASIDTTNKKPMCESNLQVVNFDKIPNDYARGRNWDGVPKSNDALYVDVYGKWYFIEFKNGTIKYSDIYRKLYDSFIMLMEWGIIPNFDFMREHVNYILVYNEGKQEKIPPSLSRDKGYNYFMNLAQEEKKLFDIGKFEKYLFNKTHTYTQALFEANFVKLKEKEENRSELSDGSN